MRMLSSLIGGCRLPVLVVVVVVSAASGALATQITYRANLDGASESPPNASPGTGYAQVDIDDVAQTMHVLASFSGLVGTTTAAHIHAPTAVAGTGTAGVATTLPTFAGFPLGVTSGTYDATLDLTAASTYNPSFVTAQGGTTAGAEAALLQSLADGTAYFNIHTGVFPAGEIRGFLTVDLVPADPTTWGRMKALYR